MWENILYLFPNLGIWTIRQDGVWGTKSEGDYINVQKQTLNKPLSTGANAHLFKLEVTRQAGCVQQLLDGGHRPHLIFFQKDLEGVGTLTSFLARSKKYIYIYFCNFYAVTWDRIFNTGWLQVLPELEQRLHAKHVLEEDRDELLRVCSKAKQSTTTKNWQKLNSRFGHVTSQWLITSKILVCTFLLCSEGVAAKLFAEIHDTLCRDKPLSATSTLASSENTIRSAHIKTHHTLH